MNPSIARVCGVCGVCGDDALYAMPGVCAENGGVLASRDRPILEGLNGECAGETLASEGSADVDTERVNAS